MFYLVLGKGEITIVVETQDVKLRHLMFEPRANPQITMAVDRELLHLLPIFFSKWGAKIVLIA